MTLFDPAAEPEPIEPRLRVRLVVAYDGGGFHGFAANTGVRTVAGTLGQALERVLGHPVDLTCAGRTDTGVHARGQVVSFDARADRVDPDAMVRSLNRLCGPEVAVRAAEVVDDDFDARFDAVSRRYRYLVLNTRTPDPLLARTVWWVPSPLELDLLRLAGDPLIGEHDFAAFCRRPKRKAGEEQVSLRRRVLELGWHDEGDGLLRLDIEATAFCHQMVRSIVGTLVAAGRGDIHPGDVGTILRRGDRSLTPNLAPPQGLCLWSVRYEGWAS